MKQLKIYMDFLTLAGENLQTLKIRGLGRYEYCKKKYNKIRKKEPEKIVFVCMVVDNWKCNNKKSRWDESELKKKERIKEERKLI